MKAIPSRTWWTLLILLPGLGTACSQQAPAPTPAPAEERLLVPVGRTAEPPPGASGGSATPVHAMGGMNPLPAGHPPIGGTGPANVHDSAGTLPPGHPPIGGAGPTNVHNPAAALPPGHPPIGEAAPPSAAPPTDSHELPLLPTGPGGAAELAKWAQTLPEGDARAQFEAAFRKTFTVNRAARDFEGALQTLDALAASHPSHAGVFRVRGYVYINRGFDVDRALADYGKAVELAPDYGEAHYALAFTHAVRDKEKGKVHFERALELGVQDVRGIGPQFYGK